jgi:hypothetical protein
MVSSDCSIRLANDLVIPTGIVVDINQTVVSGSQAELNQLIINPNSVSI